MVFGHGKDDNVLETISAGTTQVVVPCGRTLTVNGDPKLCKSAHRT
jgi:hypothetical protein